MLIIIGLGEDKTHKNMKIYDAYALIVWQNKRLCFCLMRSLLLSEKQPF